MDKKLLALIKTGLKGQAHALIEAQQQGLSSSDAMHALIDGIIGTLDEIDIPQPTGFSEATGYIYKTHIKEGWTNIKIRVSSRDAEKIMLSGQEIIIKYNVKE